VSLKERVLHAVTRWDFARSTYKALLAIPILGVGMQKLFHSAMPLGQRLWIRIPGGQGKGLWIYADPRTELGYAVGDHEPWIQELLKTELREGDCYYDAGAHTGFFCAIASRFVGSSGRIVAFEADPGNAAVLASVLAKNSISQATIKEVAVWSSSGQVTFERAPDVSNQTQGHVVCGEGPEARRASVPAIRLDDVFGEGGPAPQLIKMDVEGAEWEALQGARRLLEEAKPKLLCEIHDPADMARIRAYLEQFGYAVEEWKPSHPHYPDYSQLYLWAIAKS
jgi:FkbM family methyltransferase